MILSLVLAQVAEQAPAVAKASPAIVNNFQIALLAFKSGGWIVALIGAAAMVGRLLVDEAADASWQRSLRHVIAAAIFAALGTLGYYIAYGYIAWRTVRGDFTIGGRIPVNPSGGLESKGHPLGATGIGQLYELVTQLRGEAGPRQVEGARHAIQENGGGNIGVEEAAVAIHILTK